MREIITIQEFAKFLNENDLLYAGNANFPFCNYNEPDDFFSKKTVEKKYKVKLTILNEVFVCLEVINNQKV